MGYIVGCAKNLCNERTTKEISIDIIKNNNNKYEHIYTINSTSKNEQTKPALLPQENDNDEIKEINILPKVLIQINYFINLKL